MESIVLYLHGTSYVKKRLRVAYMVQWVFGSKYLPQNISFIFKCRGFVLTNSSFSLDEQTK